MLQYIIQNTDLFIPIPPVTALCPQGDRRKTDFKAPYRVMIIRHFNEICKIYVDMKNCAANTTIFFKFTALIAIFILSGCYDPSPELLAAAGPAPKNAPVLYAQFTGFFVSPTLILTNRHALHRSFLGAECHEIHVTTADGTLSGALTRVVAIPKNDVTDLLLLKLVNRTYPATPLVIAPLKPLTVLQNNRIESQTLTMTTYPYREVWADDVSMKILHIKADAPIPTLLEHKDDGTDHMVGDNGEEITTFFEKKEIGAPIYDSFHDIFSENRSKMENGPYKKKSRSFLFVGDLWYGQSGSPIWDRFGRLAGIVFSKMETGNDRAKSIGSAVDSSEVATFLKENGLHPVIDTSDDPPSPPTLQAMDKNVVRLFCF